MTRHNRAHKNYTVEPLLTDFAVSYQSLEIAATTKLP